MDYPTFTQPVYSKSASGMPPNPLVCSLHLGESYLFGVILFIC